MEFFEAIKSLLTIEKSSDEYKNIFSSLINNKLDYLTIRYLKNCFPIDFTSEILTEEKLNYILSLFRHRFDEIEKSNNVVFVFGCRNSGKSTIINRLFDVDLHLFYNDATGTTGTTTVDSSQAQIGISNNGSQTTAYPVVVNKNDFTLVELPDTNSSLFNNDQYHFSNWASQCVLQRTKKVLASLIIIPRPTGAETRDDEKNLLINIGKLAHKFIPENTPTYFVISKPTRAFEPIFDPNKIRKQILFYLTEVLENQKKKFEDRQNIINEMQSSHTALEIKDFENAMKGYEILSKLNSDNTFVVRSYERYQDENSKKDLPDHRERLLHCLKELCVLQNKKNEFVSASSSSCSRFF